MPKKQARTGTAKTVEEALPPEQILEQSSEPVIDVIEAVVVQPAPDSDLVTETIRLKREWTERRDAAISELLTRQAEIRRQLEELEYKPEPETREPAWISSARRPRTKRAPKRKAGKKGGYQIDPARQAQAIYGRMFARYAKTMSKREAGERARAAAERHATEHGVTWSGAK